MVGIYCVYSQYDEELRHELELHLSGLKRRGLFKNWLNRNIEADAEKRLVNASSPLEQADLILLLISPYLIESGYCESTEMQTILEKQQRKEVYALSILLHPSNWKNTLLAQFITFPPGEKPVSAWEDVDKAFYYIARGVHIAIEEYQQIQALQVVVQEIQTPLQQLEENVKNLQQRIFNTKHSLAEDDQFVSPSKTLVDTEYPRENILKQYEEALTKIKVGMLNSAQRLDQLDSASSF